jgi:hypothetical protein
MQNAGVFFIHLMGRGLLTTPLERPKVSWLGRGGRPAVGSLEPPDRRS